VIANDHSRVSMPRRRRNLAGGATLAVSGLLVLAGCGSSKSSSSTEATTSAPATTTTAPSTSGGASSSGGQTVSLEANKEGQLEYNTKTLSAKAGKMTIALTNMAPLAHDVNVESASGERLAGIEPFSGGTKDLSVTLKPGTYKFYCSVPGHRQAGMEGTLKVT
jgi:uncharacterized cupredoxin-like copper-binding protein